MLRLMSMRVFFGLAGLLLALSGCGAADDVHWSRQPVPADAYRPPLGHVVREASSRDETGADRNFLVTVPGLSGAAAKVALAGATAKSGWSSTPCVTRYESCYVRGKWFVSMIASADVRRDGVPGYGSGLGSLGANDVVIGVSRRHK
jgi:hypothetical protein